MNHFACTLVRIQLKNVTFSFLSDTTNPHTRAKHLTVKLMTSLKTTV